MKNGTVREEDGQSYLVSVGDMMSGLLFVFIITLVVFVINFHLEKMKKTEETENLKNIQKELTDAKAVRTKLLEDLKESLEKNGVPVRINREKGLLHVPEKLLFESGKAKFIAGGELSLSKLASSLLEFLPCNSGRRDLERPSSCEEKIFKPGRLEAVMIEGHTDNVRMGSNQRFKDNWDLSAQRSITTWKYLRRDQPELDRLENAEGEKLFGVSGYADTRPYIRHDETKAEPLNRRIDLRFILASPKPESITVHEFKR